MSNRNLYIGLVALTGALVLFLVWFSQHSREAAIERLEHYEIPRSPNN